MTDSSLRWAALVVSLAACGPVYVGPTGGGGGTQQDAGGGDGGMSGGGDGGAATGGGSATGGGVATGGGAATGGGLATGGGAATGGGGGSSDGGVVAGPWRFVGIPGSQCALGAQAGIGYSPAAATELVIYLQGGGACWNNGTCHPSVYQWGPVCNYGMDSICLWNDVGGTLPLAANVANPDPYPADGGGVFPSDLATISQSVLFTRRPESPFRDASWVFVPYCTGDLHAGNSTQTYFTKQGLFDTPVALTHHFAGATNMDAYLAWLRAQHPQVTTLWVVGVSGGGYGAQLNLKRVRSAFPEATVHLLADSAPMVATPHFPEWASAWHLQTPSSCTTCDGGLPANLAFQLDDATTSRVALLAFSEDQVITRFMYSGNDTASWASPPYGTYTANLVSVEALYDARAHAKYFRLPGQTHVMLLQAGAVLADGGLSAPTPSPDGGTDLKRWLDAWANGVGTWDSQR